MTHNFTTLLQHPNLPNRIRRKLEQLKFLRERPDFHPEPSAFVHIQIVTDRVAPLGRIDLTLAGFLHDICKFDCVKEGKNGWPTSPGHDDAAYELIMESDSVQTWIRNLGGDSERVALLCKYHMRFHQLGEMRPVKRERTIQEWEALGTWEDQKVLGAADNMLGEFSLDDIDASFKWNRDAL